MANTWKSLGQGSPAAGVREDTYTVPGGTSAVTSTICCANRSQTSTRVTVSHAVAGAAHEDKQVFIPSVLIPGREPYTFTVGVTLAATDKLRCMSDNGQVSFNVWGQEITP